MIVFRDLTTLEDFAAVVELEREVWGPGYHDVVPVPILAITVKRGGILIGAFDGDRLAGFVYSLAGLRHGRPMQWSHMLGVASDARNDGLGLQLKKLQRDRALAMGLDLIEWTFDPMQAMNAHFNFAKLGVVVSEYEENVYGESTSPLHAGNPTDRFVAEWHLRQKEATGPARETFGGAAAVNRARPAGVWFACDEMRLDREECRLLVEIPMGFGEMLARAPQAALDWRLATRRIFTSYFARGYRAVDFQLDRTRRTGMYLLARELRVER